MAAPLPPEVAEEMRRQAKVVRDRMSSGSSFTQTWSLGGKNAIVEPGHSVIARLLPRWDYGNSKVLQDGKWVDNPAYKVGLSYVVAHEHWWEVEGGKTTREWCLKTFDQSVRCPICEASAALVASGVKDDRDFGKRVSPKEVFLFNAVVGDPRRVNESGLADIRPISLVGTIYHKLSDIMNGGDNPKFARGNITLPGAGVDVLLKRPAGGSDRWDVQPAAEDTPLYGDAQAAAFKGWVTRLVDLPEMIEKETMTYAALYRAFYGRDPEVGGTVAHSTVQNPSTTAQSPGVDAVAKTDTGDLHSKSSPPMDPDDDAFMPPPAGAKSGGSVAPVGRPGRR
jgi:hypothetical protein